MSAHGKGWSVGGVSTPHGMEPYCNIWGPTPPGKQSGEMIACEVAPHNANVIAAAPDLFDAVQAALDEFAIGNFNAARRQRVVEFIRTAQRKARGGS